MLIGAESYKSGYNKINRTFAVYSEGHAYAISNKL